MEWWSYCHKDELSGCGTPVTARGPLCCPGDYDPPPVIEKYVWLYLSPYSQKNSYQMVTVLCIQSFGVLVSNDNSNEYVFFLSLCSYDFILVLFFSLAL